MLIFIKHSKTQRAPSNKKKGSKAFTLLELLVVVVIIGVLAAIAIPAYYKYIDKAKITVAYSTLDTIRKTLESFHIDHQRYPQNIDFLTGGENPAPPPPATTSTIFSGTLVAQINNDITVTSTSYVYNSANLSYALTAKAKDSDQTIMILTPITITKAP